LNPECPAQTASSHKFTNGAMLQAAPNSCYRATSLPPPPRALIHTTSQQIKGDTHTDWSSSPSLNYELLMDTPPNFPPLPSHPPHPNLHRNVHKVHRTVNRVLQTGPSVGGAVGCPDRSDGTRPSANTLTEEESQARNDTCSTGTLVHMVMKYRRYR
jgi:hypothetical protein